jgi:hypothetical protein
MERTSHRPALLLRYGLQGSRFWTVPTVHPTRGGKRKMSRNEEAIQYFENKIAELKAKEK